MPSVFADKVTCDIQFGNISRSTKTDNKIDWAQFEICAHKYVDVSNDGKGCALLSDSKYGFRVKDGLMSINLLRSPVYPDKTADRGKHRFRYAFYPHTGDCFSAKVPEQSYLFNLLPVETKCKTYLRFLPYLCPQATSLWKHSNLRKTAKQRLSVYTKTKARRARLRFRSVSVMTKFTSAICAKTMPSNAVRSCRSDLTKSKRFT